MTVLSVNEIKQVTFDILVHFRQFCNENEINFYLSNGTLLGAIKYGGFIPWDDDIDVFLPREDYDKLINLYQDSEKYRLFSIEREANFKYSFAKLCNMTTLKEEVNIDNGVQLGIDIDIFPLDICSEHILLPHIQRKMRVYQVGCILSKYKSCEGKAIYKRCIINCCRVLGFNFFYNKLIKLLNRECALGDAYRGCLVWPIYGVHEFLPAGVFSNKIEVEFEGEKFPAPIGYDSYLRSLYGNYELDPPLEKQKSHHNFRAYKL